MIDFLLLLLFRYRTFWESSYWNT